MTFDAPEWFLLLPALALIGWFWRSTRLLSPLRAILLILLTVALTGPHFRTKDNALDLWVLLDRSDSTEALVDQHLREWTDLLEKHKPSRHDRLRFVNYGGEVNEAGKDGATFTGSRKLTRTNLALQYAATLADPDRPSRILVFTDGYSTEPLHEATEHLQKAGIPLDFRLIRESLDNDYRVARIDIPTRVQLGEPFLLSVTVRGSSDTEVPLVIERAGHKLTETSVKLVNGVGKVEFTDRLVRTGSFEYSAEVLPKEDAHSGNNRLSRWIEVTGGPRVLLATKYIDDPTATVLRSLDFTVEVVADPSQLKPGQLTGARCVIFNNIGAYDVPQPFLDALDFYVREQGGGFLMAGGKQSFGSGGYFQSSIDALLPVSMELKNEHRKLAVALAIVLDRSGSMSVGVNAGGKMVTKMDLADAGAANAIELLGATDQVAVYAVDTAPHAIVPLTQIKDKKGQLINKVRRIESSGGGIFVYEGLNAAWNSIKTTNVGTRHVILFADANDSEEPGDYKRLLKEMTDKGCTVSVIGMGTKGDVHAKLLEEIAHLGGGRIFFSDQPADLPKIFAQETVTIARSSFLDSPVKTKPTGTPSDITPEMLQSLSQIGGYNLSYARPDAQVTLVSNDEYLAPLIAQGNRGLGRTAAIAFPLGGDYSAEVRDWQNYGNFLQTLTRWLMGLDQPAGLALRHKMEGTQLTVDLLYDPENWGQKFAVNAPKLRLLEDGPGAQPYDVPWKRLSPGHFSLTRELEEGSVVRGAVQAGSNALPFGPLNVGSSVEWAFDPQRVTELRAASNQTGGRELLDLSKAWLRPPMERDYSLRLPLVISLLVLVLLEALVTRTDWKLPEFALPERKAKTTKARVEKPKIAPAPAPSVIADEPASTPNVPQADTPLEDTERRSRYQRAKERK